MEKISLSIDGKSFTCSPGTSLLNAAEQQGIKIPRLCHHPHLEPAGACRLCLVEEEKTGRLLASCVTPAAPDMVILTNTPAIQKHRTNIVRLMMANHPESCIVCNKGNRCALRRIAAELGLGLTGLYPIPHYTGLEEANPFIVRDLSKCILCGKCIRACQELVVIGAIDYNLRGFRSRPATAHDRPLENSSCTFCGTCVSLCPTGALSLKNDLPYAGTPERESFSVCGLCCVGCALNVGVSGERIVSVNPSPLWDTANGVTLCAWGRFPYDFLHAENRLTTPQILKEGRLNPLSWEKAIETVSERLMDIKGRFGPESVAFFGSLTCTNEENYLFQKIARVLFQTNNVDNGGRAAAQPFLSLIDEGTDGGYRMNPLAWLERRAEIIFFLGNSPSESAPVAGYYLKRAARKGIPLIVASSASMDLVHFSSLWLPVAPQGDLALINSLASLLLKEGASDSAFINRFTEGFDGYHDLLSSLDREKVRQDSGLDVTMLEKAAGLMKDRKIAFVVGEDILRGEGGMKTMDALYNLSLMTGSLGAVGAGFYILSSQNNQVGAYDMGAVPDALPGRRPIRNETARQEWEHIWETKISPNPGLNALQMIDEAEKGNLKALYILGDNPLRSLPDPDRVRKALENLECIVMQGTHENEISPFAHVVLPGAAFLEKGGSFTNMEGRVQRFGPVLSPPGDARPDWEILGLLCHKLGYPIFYDSYEKIDKEIRHTIPMYGDLNGDRQIWLKEFSRKKLFHEDGEGGLIPFSI
ncbi:MAG: molybdopterin-dependent oxidoreductase [Deltaproteobacteria bacterium]|nr:molybdopterin-dependent oxidoreductase [Deltaproteobacteria bacterium]